jgi:hypothetical protein
VSGCGHALRRAPWAPRTGGLSCWLHSPRPSTALPWTLLSPDQPSPSPSRADEPGPHRIRQGPAALPRVPRQITRPQTFCECRVFLPSPDADEAAFAAVRCAPEIVTIDAVTVRMSYRQSNRERYLNARHRRLMHDPVSDQGECSYQLGRSPSRIWFMRLPSSPQPDILGPGYDMITLDMGADYEGHVVWAVSYGPPNVQLSTQLGTCVTLARLSGAMHDVFLSGPLVRERAFREIDRWLCMNGG